MGGFIKRKAHLYTQWLGELPVIINPSSRAALNQTWCQLRKPKAAALSIASSPGGKADVDFNR